MPPGCFVFWSVEVGSNIRRDRAWGRYSSPSELHRSFAINVDILDATDYRFEGDRHTKYAAKRGQRPLWSAPCAREDVRLGSAKKNPAISAVAGFLFSL
jgi:hypothetical protein